MEVNEHGRRVRAHYLPLLARHGDTNLAVDFQHAGNHAARFEILSGVGDLAKASILDVGCGIGHFYGWLRARGYDGAYTGVDLLPEMIARARRVHPGARFEAGDILADPPKLSADYVMASGIFHLGDAALMQRMIATMFGACRTAVAFNSLSSWDEGDTQGDFFCADPLETLAFCRTLTSAILLRHDYLPHDFTIFLFRD